MRVHETLQHQSEQLASFNNERITRTLSHAEGIAKERKDKASQKVNEVIAK